MVQSVHTDEQYLRQSLIQYDSFELSWWLCLFQLWYLCNTGPPTHISPPSPPFPSPPFPSPHFYLPASSLLFLLLLLIIYLLLVYQPCEWGGFLPSSSNFRPPPPSFSFSLLSFFISIPPTLSSFPSSFSSPPPLFPPPLLPSPSPPPQRARRATRLCHPIQMRHLLKNNTKTHL